MFESKGRMWRLATIMGLSQIHSFGFSVTLFQKYLFIFLSVFQNGPLNFFLSFLVIISSFILFSSSYFFLPFELSFFFKKSFRLLVKYIASRQWCGPRSRATLNRLRSCASAAQAWMWVYQRHMHAGVLTHACSCIRIKLMCVGDLSQRLDAADGSLLPWTQRHCRLPAGQPRSKQAKKKRKKKK